MLRSLGDLYIQKGIVHTNILKKACFCIYINKNIVYLYIQSVLLMDYDKVFNLRLSEAQLSKLRELGSDIGMSEWLRRCIDGSGDVSVSERVDNVSTVIDSTDKKLTADRLKDMVEKFHAKRKK